MRIIESINDKNILKCVFLAGGPGSGKSFIAGSVFGFKDTISPMGVKIINSDFFFELGLEKQGLSKVINANDKEIYDRQMAVRAIAKSQAELKKGFHIDSMLPIVIDGTGKDYEKITRQANYLKSKGYDVSMIFVNTSLDVALERNNARERKVDPRLVERMWSEVQQNMGRFQNFFGKNNFYIVDNNVYYAQGSVESEAFLLKLFKMGKRIVEEPVQNPIGQEIIEVLRSTGGKYLSDLPEDY